MNKRLLILTGAIFTAIMIGLGIVIVNKYNLDNIISESPAFTTAMVTTNKEVTKYKRGKKITSYVISYKFIVDSHEYDGSITLSEDYAHTNIAEGGFDIVYSQSNPNIRCYVAVTPNPLS